MEIACLLQKGRLLDVWFRPEVIESFAGGEVVRIALLDARLFVSDSDVGGTRRNGAAKFYDMQPFQSLTLEP